MKNHHLRNEKRLPLLMFMFLFAWVGNAQANIELTDSLSLSGFLRHQLVYNMGTKNPYNSDPPISGYGVQDNKNWLNLSRTWFIAELTYKPSDIFKLYAKTRFIWDQTTNLDDDLYDYDAITLSTPHYGSSMRLGHDNHATAEIWELYGDLNLGNLWIRLGRQQIVWGEMPYLRIMDIVNPLDYSWHFQWEPEEFENIRIPQWMARAVYNIEQRAVPWLEELYIEGFWNPGDIVPNNMPEIGNPYRPNYQAEAEWGGFYVSGETDDRRGDHEFGFRLGGKIGQVAGTLNYAYLYTDSAFVEVGNPGPPWLTTWPVTETTYPQIDVYGMTLNYALDSPLNTVVTCEATYTPDMPWYDNSVFPGIAVTESDTWRYAINFQRFTSVFQREQHMLIQLTYSGMVVEDHNKVKWTPGPNTTFPFFNKNNIVEKIANDSFVLSLSQGFLYNVYKASFSCIYQPDGAYKITPGFKYSPGDHWRFDIFASWWGGSAFDKANKGAINYFHYQDEIMFRVTYQF